VRIKPSAKDSARIVRSVHVTFKMTGSNINPATKKVVGTEEDVVPSREEIRGGDVVLTPSSPLTPGEYAIVLVPARSGADGGLPSWDFRVVQ
jgi:hypothetical protein